MSYADKIEIILSDGRFHCILDLISETGLSARNRISEMNKDYRIDKGYPVDSKEDIHQRYLGSPCNLESCDHRSDLYMYRLNNSDVIPIPKRNEVVNQKEKRQIEEWMKKSPEERKEYIQDLLIKGGIKHG
jgi:hypothetical protein